LERAEALVTQAAAQGAQIAVLPEVFNTGYEYHDRNYKLAEPQDGPTLAWMKSAARKHNLYLAGSLLLHEADEIYNAMHLISPAGKTWRYDKSCPWGWERAYFRPRQDHMAPAETELGKIGMLICWDTGHPRLWAAYAGRVDLMLVSSCPPLEHTVTHRFPDGKTARASDLGPILSLLYRNADQIFSDFFLQQSAWLGVPAVNTTGAGTFQSGLPRPKLSYAVLLAARPDLWKYVSQAEKIVQTCGYFDQTFIADARGQVRSRTHLNGDDVAVAEVELADQTPIPQMSQPKIDLSPLTYRADELVNALLVGYYNQRKN
jgi:predicted amidohydrolase